MRDAEKAELASLDKAVPLVGHSHVRFMREGVGRKTEKKSSIGRNKETSTFAIGHHTLDDRHAAVFTVPFSRRGHYVKTLLGSSAISTSAKIAANATNYSMKQVLLEVVEDTQAALGGSASRLLPQQPTCSLRA